MARTLLPGAQCERYASEGGEPGSVDHASRFRLRKTPVDRRPRGVPGEPERAFPPGLTSALIDHVERSASGAAAGNPSASSHRAQPVSWPRHIGRPPRYPGAGSPRPKHPRGEHPEQHLALHERVLLGSTHVAPTSWLPADAKAPGLSPCSVARVTQRSPLVGATAGAYGPPVVEGRAHPCTNRDFPRDRFEQSPGRAARSRLRSATTRGAPDAGADHRRSPRGRRALSQPTSRAGPRRLRAEPRRDWARRSR